MAHVEEQIDFSIHIGLSRAEWRTILRALGWAKLWSDEPEPYEKLYIELTEKAYGN